MTDLLQQIRELCNHPWKRELLLNDRIKWNKLWASMDAIEDTQLAIDTYLGLEKFDGYSGGYLYVYGLLQALNIQQDAVNNLNTSLFNATFDYKNEYPKLYEIRENRNNSIGHPTSRGNDASFHNIDRSSISKDAFTLASYFPKTGNKSTFQNIDIIESIEQQSILVNQILNKVMSKLEYDFEAHKNKFKGQSLRAIVRDDMHYEFSKLHEHIYNDYPLVEMNFNHIQTAIKKIKEGIIERYFAISALQATEDTLNLIDYIINRLDQTLIKSKIEDKFELRIFVNSFQSNFEELLEMLEEIDTEFM